MADSLHLGFSVGKRKNRVTMFLDDEGRWRRDPAKARLFRSLTAAKRALQTQEVGIYGAVHDVYFTRDTAKKKVTNA
jgi:hypothetical protein